MGTARMMLIFDDEQDGTLPGKKLCQSEVSSINGSYQVSYRLNLIVFPQANLPFSDRLANKTTFDGGVGEYISPEKEGARDFTAAIDNFTESENRIHTPRVSGR